MDSGIKSINPSEVYNRCKDKQRIVVLGKDASKITSLIYHILKKYNKHFDFFSAGGREPLSVSEAPSILIQEKKDPDMSVLGYQHHIGIISDIPASSEPAIRAFADATPKGGILIWGQTVTALSSDNKERPGITSIPFQPYQHELKNGQLLLISSTHEEFVVGFPADFLSSVSAAKETVKRLGVTSGQFYKALSDFRAN
jgi:UDP-N-acetylmuramate: L-alanyl-gamma-D-glutamyl-meso-diaminopimelate ligase